jgi:hypothetical protein
MANAAISQVPLGSEAKAVLDVPIVGAGGQVLLTLKSNVVDDAGKLCLSAGTRLVGTSRINGGVINVALTAAMVGGQQVPIPAQSVAVLKGDKSPLLAKKLNGGNGTGKIILGALLNGGSAFSQQLLSPRTTSTFSNANGTSTSSTNVANSLGNAGIAAGSSIANNVGAGLNQSLQTTDGSAQVMGIKAGTELTLVFSGPVQLLSASADIPAETAPDALVAPASDELEGQTIPVSSTNEELQSVDALPIDPVTGQPIEIPNEVFNGNSQS